MTQHEQLYFAVGFEWFRTETDRDGHQRTQVQDLRCRLEQEHHHSESNGLAHPAIHLHTGP